MDDALAVQIAQPCQDLFEETPGDPLLQLVPLLTSNHVTEVASRVEVQDHAVEVADRDDLVEGDNVGVTQVCHDGGLPLQVLRDVGVLDLVKRHHLESHLLVENDVVGQNHFAEGPLAESGRGQLVVAN